MSGATSSRSGSDPMGSQHGFAYAVMGLAAFLVLAAWHLAVATTIETVALGDVSATVDALTSLAPIAGLPGPVPAKLTATYAAFAGYVVALAVAATVVAIGLIRARDAIGFGIGSRRHGRAGMASRSEVKTALGEAQARATAVQTRPAMSETIRKRANLEELALCVGRDESHRSPVWLPLQDHLAVLAPTGGGKSVYVMIPAALSAPGALVVTSNEVSILDIIATARAKRGRVWVFDPLGRSSWPEPMVWNPVRGCEDGETALSRGVAFASGLKAGKDASTNAGFFQHNAMIALSRMLHAAAIGGREMSEVLRWTVNLDTDARIASGILRSSSDERVESTWAGMLDSVATGADETVASSRQTLQQAVEPLTLRKVTRWVTPQPGVEEFDAAAFVTSTDTLVLISDDSSSTNVGPLCTMLFQEVMDAIKALAPLSEHGRLDPPMRVVGDEVANVAPIEKLPELASEVRKLGVQLVLAFQSEQQLRSRWGDRGQTLLEQMSAELVLPGLKSSTSLKRYSDLAGRVQVDQHTMSFGEGGDVRGGSTSEREREVLRTDEVRQMRDGTGLLVWRNAAPLIVELTAWFKTREADQIARDAKDVTARRHEHARSQRTAAGVSTREDER